MIDPDTKYQIVEDFAEGVLFSVMAEKYGIPKYKLSALIRKWRDEGYHDIPPRQVRAHANDKVEKKQRYKNQSKLPSLSTAAIKNGMSYGQYMARLSSTNRR